MAILILIPIPIIICYYAIQLSTWRLKPFDKTTTTTANAENITIIIALHNEERNIHQLADSLKTIADKVAEIILVCDHCTDQTYPLLASLQLPRTRILINPNAPGKKNAQRYAVEQATTEYILATDADCQFSPQWPAAFPLADSPDLIIAPVLMLPAKGVTQRLMALEFIAIQMATYATAANNRPTMCNGANMLFRRSLYLNHDPKTRYASGDDMFLLQAAKSSKAKITYANNPDALVTTSCPPSIKAYFNQRMRWFGKAGGYSDWDVKKLALLMFLANMAVPVLILTHFHTAAFAVFIVKFFADYALLQSAQPLFRIKPRLADALLLSIAYPIIIVVIAIGSLFRSKKKW